MACSIHGTQPCGCCTCTLTRAGRTADPDCPVPSHSGGYTEQQMGAAIGRQMTEIIDSKRWAGR